MLDVDLRIAPNFMAIYFYKADQPYGCFSNFSPHTVRFGGRGWLTAEHCYQAQKFDDRSPLVEQIQAAPTPEAAATIGRSHVDDYRPHWDSLKLAIMFDIVRDKFRRHGDIQRTLLATGDRELIENSPVDDFWGCGADHTGTNYLGKILMRVRYELRADLAARAIAHARYGDALPPNPWNDRRSNLIGDDDPA